MRHKLEYIESISNETDLACLTETHLDQNITNDSILIEGYCKVCMQEKYFPAK
jgi:hypothetical protein